jgi:hypothetical protein
MHIPPLPSAPPTPEDIREAEEKIQTIDLSRIENRLKRERLDWDNERITTAIQEYRRYLTMILIFSDHPFMPPTRDSDEVWHAHILHTIKYAEDCESVFGIFIDHEPADGGGPPPELVQVTYEAYRMIFHSDPQGLTPDWIT